MMATRHSNGVSKAQQAYLIFWGTLPVLFVLAAVLGIPSAKTFVMGQLVLGLTILFLQFMAAKYRLDRRERSYIQEQMLAPLLLSWFNVLVAVTNKMAWATIVGVLAAVYTALCVLQLVLLRFRRRK
ncbi:hypothetical protein [Schleiferilactobacillus shenzhenensis]|uniref:hypothetical protein n=1 Tax=Schleiferilactobacillus shenzhenensis TaxID=1231337 RepID=UPI00058C8F2D|nr:hypothetical protein [Schleiferilactobacillus shenzhenensis]